MAFILNQTQSLEEMDELRQLFITLDTSNDGLLTVQEIHDGLNSIMGVVKGNMKHFEHILVDLDKDCNGVVDYSEFITAAINKNKVLTENNLEKCFKLFDSDNSGQISQDEL